MGINKGSSTEDIRKAFKKLVCKYHPDKGPDPEKYKELINAYEVLSDPKKRKIYDEYGEEGLTKAEIGEDLDLFNFYDCLYPRINNNLKRKYKTKLIELNITLEDSYNGGKKEIEYNRMIICPKCKGSGLSNPNEESTCLKYNEEGNIIKEKCQECKGNMVQTIKRKMEIDIEKGVPDGHRYKMSNEGDEYPGYETGDLVVEIILQKHKDFIRKGADIFYNCKITLLESLTGVKIAINHLDGRRILIQSKPDEIIQPEGLKTIKGLGMPFFNSPDKYGNLYIDFKIVFPKQLTKEQKNNISEIFKNEKINIVDDLNKDMEKYHFEDYNESETNPHYKGGTKEDREENGPKCNNQ